MRPVREREIMRPSILQAGARRADAPTKEPPQWAEVNPQDARWLAAARGADLFVGKANCARPFSDWPPPCGLPTKADCGRTTLRPSTTTRATLASRGPDLEVALTIWCGFIEKRRNIDRTLGPIIPAPSQSR
jgi:hypothetical protein